MLQLPSSSQNLRLAGRSRVSDFTVLLPLHVKLCSVKQVLELAGVKGKRAVYIPVQPVERRVA